MKGRFFAAVFAPPSSAVPTPANRVCSINCLAMIGLSFPIAGTTRDTIEETANIRGIPVVFVDTAGLREARDEIEVEGIKRSHQSLAQAELILHVLDASEPLTAEDQKYLAEFAARKRLLVRNKIDLPHALKWPHDLNAPV